MRERLMKDQASKGLKMKGNALNKKDYLCFKKICSLPDLVLSHDFEAILEASKKEENSVIRILNSRLVGDLTKIPLS